MRPLGAFKMLEEIWNRMFGYKCEECGKLTTKIKEVAYVDSDYYGNARLEHRDYCYDCKPRADLIVNPPYLEERAIHFYHSKVTRISCFIPYGGVTDA